VNAFLLAGGRSTRMGRDKALLELEGRPLIGHAAEKLRALGFPPRIAASRPDLSSFADVIPDRYLDSGPLGGIEAALTVSDAEQNLFLPVDLPLLPVRFLQWMVERVAVTHAVATIPRVHGRPQPLCAVYGRGLLPYVRVSLDAADRKVMRVVEHAAEAAGERIDSFDVESVASALSWETDVPLHRWFENLNTPRDFEKAALEQSARIH
jgi:molybdopterin-guanine dinucleotide biosynthesis protein A